MNDLIAKNDNTTIISKYDFTPKKQRAYQSEQDLENFLLEELVKQGYERLNIKDISELENNLKISLERLNDISFKEQEWQTFYKENINNPRLNQQDKIAMIQTSNYTLTLTKEDKSKKNIKLIDRKNPLNNRLQVISQLQNNQGEFKNRYDVSILVNGLPLVHIELKRRGVNLKEAFNQIKRYQRESFSGTNALFEFVQIFIISNGTMSKYYASTTKEDPKNNYAFCMSFSDAQNNIIEDLEDFTKTFLAKRNLLNILTKYCVFNADKELLIMRPYQIAASERIINKIKMAHTYKLYGKAIEGKDNYNPAGGYIWHSTGSGKTLTSFKTALLATELDFIKKVLFVVDRKDLDYQTQKEYDAFEEGAANSTKDTKELRRRLESKNDKIVITTIQKLSNFIQKYENSQVFDNEIVFIFDECHRSQFGLMHEAIIKKFKKYYIFGFTGTPIFEENAGKNYASITLEDESKSLLVKTTKSTFGECLHSYTILNAIKDKNVLPFKVSYISTMKSKNAKDEEISTIDTEKSLLSNERISQIVKYILKNFNRHTKRENAYILDNKRKQGFNAIFATASTDAAKKYYEEFQKQLQNSKEKLRVGIIYSYEANEDLKDCDELSAKEFLSKAIKDYNKYFKSTYSLERFDEYYKNISQKLKDKELDLLIVVNMFLTGFDSKTINTLYVDKNLKYHSLLQAFSRTNRTFHEQKTCGNVICFRDLEKDTNDSLKMFGNERAQDIVLLESYEFYLEKYEKLVSNLKENFDLNIFPLSSEEKQKEFIKIFNEFLKLENLLSLFDEFQNPLSLREKQDYQSHYIELYEKYRNYKKQEKTNINDDLIFEIELIKQNEINVDFILFLLESYHKDKKDKTKEHISKILISNPSLRDKKELIEEFLNTIDNNKNIDFITLFKNYMQEKKEKELNLIIKEENLQEQQAKQYLEEAFELGVFRDKGVKIQAFLPKIDIFAPKSQNNDEKIEKIITRLKDFFEKFKFFSKKEI